MIKNHYSIITCISMVLCLLTHNTLALPSEDRSKVERYIGAGEYEEALIEITNLERGGAKNDSELLMLKGIVYSGLPQYMDQAPKVLDLAYKHAKKRDDRKNEILFFKARALHRVERFQECLDLCTELLTNKKNLNSSSFDNIIAFQDFVLTSRELLEDNRKPADVFSVTAVNTSEDEKNFLVPITGRGITIIDTETNTLKSDLMTAPNFYLPEDKKLESFTFDLNQTICILGVDQMGEHTLMVTKRKGKEWSVPVPVEGVRPGGSNDIHPHLTPDGKTLYFSSDRPRGHGGFDIYKAERTESGAWSTPVNIGPEVNTIDDEFHPWLQVADNTLYFSSNGHLTVGGFDILAYNTNTKKIKHLGAPINSTADDFVYMEDITGKLANLSSRRRGGNGRCDIYLVEYLEKKPSEMAIFSNTVSNDFDLINNSISVNVNGERIDGIKPNIEHEFHVVVPTNARIEVIQKDALAVTPKTINAAHLASSPLMNVPAKKQVAKVAVVEEEKKEEVAVVEVAEEIAITEVAEEEAVEEIAVVEEVKEEEGVIVEVAPTSQPDLKPTPAPEPLEEVVVAKIESTSTPLPAIKDTIFHIYFEANRIRLTEYTQSVIQKIISRSQRDPAAKIVVSDIAWTSKSESNTEELSKKRLQALEGYLQKYDANYQKASIDSEKAFVVNEYFTRMYPYLRLRAKLTDKYIANLKTPQQQEKAELINRRIRIEIRHD